MRWKIDYHPKDGIVQVETEGQVSVENINTMVKEANRFVEARKSHRVLVDHRKLTGELSTLEIYERPDNLQSLKTQRSIKFAFVVTPSQVENFRFFETVCINRGYIVSTFLDKKSAKDWLI